jgi:hypothetical protein
VSASWAQAAVTRGTAGTFSSFWAGLDGDGTPTVEQTGTEADCPAGAATYQGWYGICPNAPVATVTIITARASEPGGDFRLTVPYRTRPCPWDHW